MAILKEPDNFNVAGIPDPDNRSGRFAARRKRPEDVWKPASLASKILNEV